MSLLAKKNIGLILMSALLIFSCKEKENIGLTLPGDDVGAFYTDTVSFKTEAVLKNDNIITSDQSYSFAGAYKDPKFGNVKAESYLQLKLKDELVGLEAGVITVNDVTLNLAYDYHYGDTIEIQELNVFKLDGSLDPDKTYYSTSTGTDVPPIGADIDTDAGFSLTPIGNANVAIKLDNSFGSEVLTFIGTAGQTNSDFQNAFKGLAIIPQADNVGALFGFKIFDSSSKIIIKYQIGSGTEKQLELHINSGASFSRILSDRSLDPILSSFDDPGDFDSEDAGGKIYLQAGIGIRTKITFPTLNLLKEKQGTIAINRAELIFEVNPETVQPPSEPKFTPPSSIFFIKLNQDGKPRQFLNTSGNYQDAVVQTEYADVNGNSSPLVVNYNSTTNSYTCNISTYLHGLLNGTVENNGLLITPLSGISNAVNRVIVDPATANGGKVYMRIYYTRVE